MAGEPSAVEQAVSRTLRDNLGRIQRTSEELNQAISDLVSACASSRATNALPPMVRAQSAAASLSAAFEVLARFVTASLQPAPRSPFDDEVVRLTSAAAIEPHPAPDSPAPPVPTPMAEQVWNPPPPEPAPSVAAVPSLESAPPMAPPAEPVSSLESPPSMAAAPSPEPAPSTEPPPLELAPFEAPASVDFPGEPVPVIVHEPSAPTEPAMALEPPGDLAMSEPSAAFNLASLPADEQELHRRAYRVAKVSMQDIKLLRPEDVRVGRENKDLCIRLRDDIEKAHKEYDRRFQAIQSHPVDYFYDWMVEILAGGNPEALGAYPYPSPALRH
jgi:hypothetical protein